MLRGAIMLAAILTACIPSLAKAEEPSDGEAAYRATVQNLKLLSIAMHNYHDRMKSFPPAVVARDGKPLLSWRVTLLPYVETPGAAALYEEFHLDEPWDSDHNKALIARMPDVYQSPYSKLKDGRTVYLTPRGDKTAFPGERGVKIREVIDGTSRTIGLVEVDDERAVVWTRPDDWQPDPQTPSSGLGVQAAGFVIALMDGSVHLVPKSVSRETLNALLTRNGRENVSIPQPE